MTGVPGGRPTRLPGVTQDRMSRDEFFGKVAGLGETELRTALWTLYWRGTKDVRERVLAVVDPESARLSAAIRSSPPDGEAVLAEVRYFTELARHGAYFAGDRRVSPKERTRWRYTFRRLATEAQDGLRGPHPDAAGEAVALMVESACQSRDVNLFRSEDPVEAARFVVSDAVEALWLRMRDVHGAGFLGEAVNQLVRWESRYGWTRQGRGWVFGRERSLASVLAALLTSPDLWRAAAEAYVAALDRRRVAKPTRDDTWTVRLLAENLSEWNELLLERLTAPDEEDLVNRIVAHPALGGTRPPHHAGTVR